MGWHAARKLRRVVDNLAMVLAVELVAAARAIELRAPLQPAPATAEVIRLLRQSVAGPGEDRFLAPELEAAAQIVATGSLPHVPIHR